jgi:hypothetical protein
MHEQCLRCDHFDHSIKKCLRVFKGRVYLSFEGGRLSGDMNFETLPGLLTKELENDLAEFLSHWVPTMIERWKGWEQVVKLFEGEKDCAAEQPSKCIQEFGVSLKLVKPLKDEEDDIPGYKKTEGWSGF